MILLLALATACLPVGGDRITAGDIAAAVPAFRVLPADKVLSYAPLPGHTRVFPEAELRQRVPEAAELPASVCFEWPMHALSTEEVQAAMLAVLPPDSTVSLAGLGPPMVPPGSLRFPLTGLRNGRWEGHVEWAPGRKSTIWARVDVRAPFARVIAAEALRPGDRIESTAIRLETGTGDPQLPGIASRVEDVLGRVTRRLIPAGVPIPLASLEADVIIARGDPVHVQVVAGRTTLGFDGIAEGRAAIGQLVPVRNPATKRLVHARVEARGRAIAALSP